MESQNQKWVNGSFLAVSAIVGYIVFAAAFKLAGVYDFETKVKNLELLVRFGSVGIGVVLFTILYRSDSANQFMHEVVTELSRVTWPTSKETWGNTWIVLIAVLVTSVFLWVLDTLWARFIQFLI